MAQRVREFAGHAHGPESTHIKRPGMAESACNCSSAVGVETGGSWRWPASLAEVRIFSSVRPCLQGLR